MDFLQTSLLFAVWGFAWSRILTQPGMIFDWVGVILSRLPDRWQKPAFVCPSCVAGSHCLVYTVFARVVENADIAVIPTVVLAVFGAYLLDTYVR